MSRLRGILQQAMDASERRDINGFLACMTDDIEYQYHINARPLIGKLWVEKFLRKYWDSMTDTVWRIDRWVEEGDILMVEGAEQYVVKATGETISHPYMGICEFRGEQIARMRDYFEL